MLSLLYIDDEALLLELGKIFLEETGDFSVITGGSAQAGLEALRAGTFDAVVSDYQMPGMDGIEFLKVVRKEFGSLPFILFTGRGREDVVIEAINQGADFYLQKGGEATAQFAELAHKIRQAVSRRHAQDELRAAYEQVAATEEELRSQYDELVISEQRIRESEKMFRELFDVVPAACMVSDEEGRYTLVNRAFEESSGFSSAEAAGRTSVDLGLSDATTFRELMRLLQETGRIDNGELVITTRPGDKRTLLLSSRKLVLSGSTRYITAILDITDRKKAETALRESEGRFRAIIEQSPFSMVVFAPSGQVIHVNDASLILWGTSREAAMQYNILRDPQMEKLGLLPVVRRAFAGEAVITPPREYNLADALGKGQKRRVLGNFYPVRNDAGEIMQVILVHQDLTGRHDEYQVSP